MLLEGVRIFVGVLWLRVSRLREALLSLYGYVEALNTRARDATSSDSQLESVRFQCC